MSDRKLMSEDSAMVSLISAANELWAVNNENLNAGRLTRLEEAINVIIESCKPQQQIYYDAAWKATPDFADNCCIAIIRACTSLCRAHYKGECIRSALGVVVDKYNNASAIVALRDVPGMFLR